MKLYAVVIGEKKHHQRYVSLSPLSFPNLTAGDYPLAVYGEMKKAKKAKKQILKTCGHKSAYIKTFVTN